MLRDSDNSDSTLTHDVCSPRWIVYPDSHAWGARTNAAARNQRQCLEDCVAETRCLAAEWDETEANATTCWFHVRNASREHLPDITQYEIIRNCDAASRT